MFVIPCFNLDNRIINLVDSIRKFHTQDKILICDSNSSDKNYINILKNKYENIFFEYDNKHYVDSAIWKAYESFKDEDIFYVLHDSMIVNQSLEEFTNKEFTSYMYFNTCWHNEAQKNYAKLSLESKTSLEFKDNFNGLFGITFITKRSVLDKLYEKGLNKVLPSSKNEMMASERIWGMCLEQIGIDFINNTIKGNFFHNSGIGSKVDGAITKMWMNRQ